VRPARVERSLRLELVDEPVQPLGVNVQVDDCGAELTEHTAHVPPLGPRLGEALQQPHYARAFLAQLRELGLDQLDPMRLCRTSGRLHSRLPETLARRVDVLEERPDLGFPVPDGALVRFRSRLFPLDLLPVLFNTLRKPPDPPTQLLLPHASVPWRRLSPSPAAHARLAPEQRRPTVGGPGPSRGQPPCPRRRLHESAPSRQARPP